MLRPFAEMLSSVFARPDALGTQQTNTDPKVDKSRGEVQFCRSQSTEISTRSGYELGAPLTPQGCGGDRSAFMPHLFLGSSYNLQEPD